MNMSKVFVLFMALFLAGQGAWAGGQTRPVKAVMMPLATPFSQEENTQLAAGIADGLSSRYEVLHGKEVDGIIKRIFDEENKGLNCDLNICYQKIARHFGAENIVALVVAPRPKKDGGMSLSLSVLNVLENKVVLKRQVICKSARFSDVLKVGAAFVQIPEP